MNMLSPLARVIYITIGLLFLLSISGCEPYQAITFENKSSIPVKVNIDVVPLDYNGIPTRTWSDPGVLIQAGETSKFLTRVKDNRRGGTRSKYPIVAVAENNEIVLSRVFTWDELHDMDWTVVIGGSDSNNITMGNILGSFQYRPLQCRM